MATISTRLTNTGTLLVNGTIDEVTFSSTTPTITNLLTYSEQFNNVTWSKARSSVTADAIMAPDGTFTADKLVEDTTANITHYINGSYYVSSTLPTGSIYVKAAERTSCGLAIIRDNGSAFAYSTFNVDLTTGTVLSGTGTISNAGNGWYRISATATSSGANYALRLLINQSGTTSTYNGDGASGLYIWGAQLEPGTVATTYQGVTTANTLIAPTWSIKTVPNTVYSTGNFDEVTYNSTAPVIKNLLWQTQNWTANIQSSANVSVTANSILAPDGTQTGSTITTTVGGYSNDALIQKWNPTGISTAALPYCLSVYVKQGNCPTIGLNLAFYNGNTYQDAILTLTWANLSISTAGGSNTGTLNYGVIDTGLGWYRLWCSATNNYSAVGVVGRIWVRSVYNNNIAGDYNYAWGMQIEQGSSPTIYQGKGAITILTPNFARREDRTGNMYVTNSYDEYTGAPVIDSSVVLWLDPTQTASYSGTGTTWTDLSTAQNNGTLTSSTSFDSITGGGSFNFAGTNYATLAANLVSSGSRTITMAFKPTDNVNRSGVISNRDGAGGWFVCINRNGAQLLTYSLNNVATNNDLSANVISQTNVWYLATITHDAVANIGNIYLNGNLSVSATMGTILPITTLNSYVGREVNSGQNFPGWIGDVIVYNRALTADEVAQNFNALRRRYNI